MSKECLQKLGNGTIDRYPPVGEAKIEKLLVFNEKTFQSLVKEFHRLKPRKQRAKKPRNVKKTRLTETYVSKTISKRTYQEYQPSTINNVYYSDPWRWRRVNEWFSQQAQTESNEASIVNEIVALRASQRLII